MLIPTADDTARQSPDLSTAVVAAIGQGTEFKNSRHFAAWVDLVPRQHSSGGQACSDEYDEIRRQASFIHAARVVVSVATNNNDSYINQLVN